MPPRRSTEQSLLRWFWFLTLPSVPLAQMVKCLSTVWETEVRSLGQKDPLEKGLLSMGSQRVGHNWATSLSLSAPLTVFPPIADKRGFYPLHKSLIKKTKVELAGIKLRACWFGLEMLPAVGAEQWSLSTVIQPTVGFAEYVWWKNCFSKY